jgi:hypothetical protein
MNGTALIHGSAALLAGLGALQVVIALHDAIREPRFLKPVDKPLLGRLKKTRPSVAAAGRSYWEGVIGLNLSSALGLFTLAFLVELAQSPLMGWIRLPLIALAALYALIAWRALPRVPAQALALATVLLAGGWYW